MNKERSFTASLHTHVRSIYDANIDPEALCRRIEELGGKGCAITDHGVLSSIEDYRAVFSAHNLKMIPGCEIYVDGGILGRLHMIVLAVNDRGYKGISKIVTKSNENLEKEFPIVKNEDLVKIMKEYRGDIIATSACMQGVVSAVYLQNEFVNRKINKLLEKQSAYIGPNDPAFVEAKENVTKLNELLTQLTSERDRTKALAEAKFSNREKALEKAKKAGQNVEKEEAELKADKEKSQLAGKALPEIKDKLNQAKKDLSAANAVVKKMEESYSKYIKYENEILDLKKEYKDDEELEERAAKVANFYRNLFGDENFYMEVQYHGIDEEKICYPKVAALARKLQIPIVATNDVHILRNSADDRLQRQILRSTRYGNWEQENKGDEELYLKDDEELAKALRKIFPEDIIEEAIENIEVIFDRCNVTFEAGKHYPKFSAEADSDAILDEEIRKGIAWRFPEGMDKAHEDRLAYELPIIKKMGYADYHLVVKDFLEYGRLLGYVPKNRLQEAPLTINELKEFIRVNGWKNQGLLIGPGRGSAVGSLVCYLLGITALDPLKYDLLFERFLNPERISMPDIDSDISATTRGKVIEYVQNKYGNKAVCGIMTQTFLAPKGAIRMAAKFYGLKTRGEALTRLGDEITRQVPDDVGVKFKTSINAMTGSVATGEDKDVKSLYEYLLAVYSTNKDAQEIIRWASLLEGAFTSYGAHAAGIVISDNQDISDYIPLRMNTKLGMMTTQCDMVQVEDNGLLKFDFLGLKTLDIITETSRMIESNYGIIIDPLTIDLADRKVYETILANGKTNSVFQFESTGMKTMLKRFKPESFEDLIILVSMFRPGPLQYLDGVIDVKNGVKPMTFLTPQLQPILQKTYGAIVYQEQVMEICQKLAGFTLGHADQVRRYMSKKKHDKLAHERDAFVEGCKNNNISSEIANELFDQMMDFASYAFNKSHAAAYAFNAYITAWLKCYYPAEFFASALNWAENSKISGLMYEARDCGVEVKAPDINLSEKEFSVINGKIQFGLSAVAGVKDHANEIISGRTEGMYDSLKDFLIRIRPNSAVIDHLISAGAFDSFSKNRAAMKQMVNECRSIIPVIDKKTSFINSAELVLPYVEKSSVQEIMQMQETAGLKVEIAEQTNAEKLQNRIDNAKKALLQAKKELALVKEPAISEDKQERMKLEKEYLGMYVTEHPMDFFPSAGSVGAVTIEHLSEGPQIAYGVVTNLQIKKRKSDGEKFAIFDLEDKTGTMEVAVFTRAYSSVKENLVEGSVVKITGKLRFEEKIEKGDEGEEVILIPKFTCETMEPVDIMKPSFIMHVSSYAVFHVDIEESFKEVYEDKTGKGRKLFIFDQAMDEIREMTYTVNEDVLKLPHVEETYIK